VLIIVFILKNLSTGKVISVPSKMITGNTLILLLLIVDCIIMFTSSFIPVDAVQDGLGYNLGIAYISLLKP